MAKKKSPRRYAGHGRADAGRDRVHAARVRPRPARVVVRARGGRGARPRPGAGLQDADGHRRRCAWPSQWCRSSGQLDLKALARALGGSRARDGRQGRGRARDRVRRRRHLARSARSAATPPWSTARRSTTRRSSSRPAAAGWTWRSARPTWSGSPRRSWTGSAGTEQRQLVVSRSTACARRPRPSADPEALERLEVLLGLAVVVAGELDQPAVTRVEVDEEDRAGVARPRGRRSGRRRSRRGRRPRGARRRSPRRGRSRPRHRRSR